MQHTTVFDYGSIKDRSNSWIGQSSPVHYQEDRKDDGPSNKHFGGDCVLLRRFPHQALVIAVKPIGFDSDLADVLETDQDEHWNDVRGKNVRQYGFGTTPFE